MFLMALKICVKARNTLLKNCENSEQLTLLNNFCV